MELLPIHSALLLQKLPQTSRPQFALECTPFKQLMASRQRQL